MMGIKFRDFSKSLQWIQFFFHSRKAVKQVPSQATVLTKYTSDNKFIIQKAVTSHRSHFHSVCFHSVLKSIILTSKSILLLT